MNVLMIGRSPSLCQEMLNYEEQYDVYIIEESDILKKKEPFYIPNVKGIYEGKYQQSNEFMNIVMKLAKEIKFDLVVPVFEYSVKAANTAAEYLGLPRVGNIGAKIFTDKLEFRRFCEEVGIPHPRFSKVESMDDIKLFFDKEPIIFKPANRHASIGVVQINKIEDIPAAYQFTTSADESVYVPERKLNWGYLVEDMVKGDEYSVEILVQSGEIKFINFTEKWKFENRYFVESGHRVPAELGSDKKDLIKQYMKKLIDNAQIETSILHAEWMVGSEDVWIIECAGRRPGDRITDLISIAYNTTFMESYIKILSGREITISNTPSKSSAIKYFTVNPGVLTEIKGKSVLSESNSGVYKWEITKEPGDKIFDVSSSWERVGYFILEGENNQQIDDRIKRIEENLRFIVKQ